MSMRATCATGEIGGVNTGDEEPNSATSGTPTAAAACIRPESLATTTRGRPDSRSMAVPRSVRPVRSWRAATGLAGGLQHRGRGQPVVGRPNGPDLHAVGLQLRASSAK